jgi:hypothetical protein
MRLTWWALLGSAGLLAGSPGLAAEPVEKLRARCPTTRNLAPEAFEGEAARSAADLDEWQKRIRGNLGAEAPPPEAEVVLRAFAGGSMTQSERSETATMLWRLPDGSWHFVEANHYPNRMVSPPPPPEVLTEEQIQAARRSIESGPLDRAQAMALDSLLADPCLEAEPSVAAGALPLRAGLPPMGPCFDAVAQTVEVVRAGRRRVYVQTCLRFLAGELIGLALYPRREGEALPGMPTSRPLDSLEGARRFADQVLRASHGGDAWINVTQAAGSYAFAHRASGFTCAATQPYEIEVYGPHPNEPAAEGARCLRNSSMQVRTGVFKTEWQVARRKSGSDVKRRVRSEAEDWFSGYHGSAARPRIRMGRLRVDGVRMWRAEVAGEPNVDARDDELTVALGAEHDGWVVVARATGSATDPAAVEAAAARLWRHVLETRSSPAAGP